MSFEPTRYRDIATYLLEEATLGDREAPQRTTVGRLYYATFLRARRYLRSRGVRAATLGSVVAGLNIVPELSGVGADLDLLHDLRNQCDYDDSNDFSQEQVTLALRLVRGIDEEMSPHW